MSHWLDNLKLDAALSESIFDWWKRAHLKEALINNKSLVSLDVGGYIESDITTSSLNKDILNEGFKLLSIEFPDENSAVSSIYYKDDSILSFSSGEEYGTSEISYNIHMKSTNIVFVSEFKKKFSAKFKKIPKDTHVKMLVRCGPEYAFSDIGKIDSKFQPLNYDKGVVEDYRFLIKELASDDPTGRLTILYGNPGTGKSYFIRSLITEGRGTFVYVPSNLISSLSSPDVVATLVSERVNKDPLVLILEDADNSLLSRENNSSSNISDILNLSDGLLGELADIRIVATTNLSTVEFDKAILRAGRLNKEIKFEEIKKDDVSCIYKRLTGKEPSFELKDMSLAEIYRHSRGEGWKSKEKKDVVSGTYI